jgi:hypothetical protein
MMHGDAEQSSRLARWYAQAFDPLAALFAYLIAMVVFTWPLALHPGTMAAVFSGDTLLNAFIVAWDQHALLNEPGRLFSPNFFHPTRNALCLSENMIVPALLTLPLAGLGNPILVYNVILLGSFPASAWCWWLVLRRWGAGWTAAWIGGLMFGFSPWRFGQLGHMQLMLNWWVPLVLLGVDAWLRGAGMRWALLAAAAMAAQFYSCVYHFYFTCLYLVPFAGVGFLIRDWRSGVPEDAFGGRPRSSLRAIIVQGGIAAALFVALLAPAWRPYREIRWILFHPNPLEALARTGASAGDYFRGYYLNLLYGPRQLLEPNPYSPFPWEHWLWPGWSAMALTLLLPLAWFLARRSAMWSDDRRRRLSRVAMMAAGAGALFFVSLGPAIHWRGEAICDSWPYMALHWRLPGFDAIRVPARASIMVVLTLSGLAAIAADGLLRWARAQWGRAGAGVLAGMLLTLTAADLLNRPLPVSDNPDYARHRAVHAMLAREPEGVVLAMPVDTATHYVSTLAAAEHFFPMINGTSGYLLRSNGETFDRLREPAWDRSHLDLLRWLRVRYIVLDQLLAEASEWPPPPALGSLLAENGLLDDVSVYPDARTIVYRLKPTTSTMEQRLTPTEQDFDLNTMLIGGRPSLAMFITYRGPHWLVSDDQQPLTWTAIGEDTRGETIWRQSERGLLPHFLLEGETFGIPVQARGKLWIQTARVSVRVRLKGLDIHLKQERTAPPVAAGAAAE